MRLFIVVLLISILTSCSEKEFIYYEYSGVTITRIDKTGESYFYYGKCDGKDLPCEEDYIKAEYYGFDGDMGAYLIFQEDKKVRLVGMYESFEKHGSDSSLFVAQRMENIDFIDWEESIEGDFKNVVRVAAATSQERKINISNNSRVKALYSHLD